jgi:hypothetical protein
METVTLKNAPIKAITYPKKGIVSATTTVLITITVLTRILRYLLSRKTKVSSIAVAIGAVITAYFVRGLTRVVYIASFEPIFLIGRFKVT